MIFNQQYVCGILSFSNLEISLYLIYIIYYTSYQSRAPICEILSQKTALYWQFNPSRCVLVLTYIVYVYVVLLLRGAYQQGLSCQSYHTYYTEKYSNQTIKKTLYMQRIRLKTWSLLRICINGRAVPFSAASSIRMAIVISPLFRSGARLWDYKYVPINRQKLLRFRKVGFYIVLAHYWILSQLSRSKVGEIL